MTPILAVAVALVLADHRQMVTSAALVLAGAGLVIVTGYSLGLMVPFDVVAASNGQVAARVEPRLIDLVAALATGLVGAFAMVRDDVSDTLPGVAIAISLVPPLAVVGLAAEAGAWTQSAGALLLFATNVAAIVCTGTALLALSGLRQAAEAAGRPVGRLRGRTSVAMLCLLTLVALPPGYTSQRIARDQMAMAAAGPVVRAWVGADERVTEMSMENGRLTVVLLGPSRLARSPSSGALWTGPVSKACPCRWSTSSDR